MLTIKEITKKLEDGSTELLRTEMLNGRRIIVPDIDGEVAAGIIDLVTAASALCAPYSEVTDAQLRFCIDRPKGAGVYASINISAEVATAVLIMRAAIVRMKAAP